MRVYRVDETSETGRIAIYDIMEATYTGQDMGKRMITAVIKHPTPIDFKIGDYVEFSMQSLLRSGNHGEIMEPAERFYIYTEPQCKKTARPMSSGDAFEITVNFYPRQYELTGIQMRDFIQQGANSDFIIYTGFDTVTFYGGARELLDRCMACLAQHYKDDQGNPLWSYVLDDSLNEDKNNALERYTFSFQGNSVMDALLKLNDKDYINTTFFINDRTIYVGFKRPFLCAVDSAQNITNKPLELMYGKTSHMPIDLDHGGLYDITKSVGEELPITKLFAYGAARNLNRYYCADRIKSGRFVNKLMLPSFSDDGETDYIISEDGVKKYGVREGSKDFEEIYPSLRYMTYADIRGIKYCIKVKTSGLESDQFKDGKMDHTNDESRAKRPLARVQCYKVTPCTGENGDGTVGVNKLVECAPPEDLAVFIHATGKTVKVVLMADKDGQTSIQRQLAHDFGIVPVRTYGGTDYIPGACFCVHDVGFSESDPTKHYTQQDREDWFNAQFRRFNDSDSLYAETPEQQVAELHRIEYVDTFWLTDLYVMEYENGEAMYDAQRHFSRAGYSAWAWPRLNNESVYPETLPVNEVVGVEPIVIADTSENIDGGRQQHWDIYLRDIGFAIDEQNDFGEMVFVFSTPVVSVLDGTLAGREFTIDGGDNLNDFQDRVVCAYNEDGTFNHDFMFPGDSGDAGVASKALMNGAIWRIRLNRNDNDSQLSSIGLVLPNTDIAMKAGNHIVLLDIYMPDIYIRAAEQRLLREAQWFLEKNDRANVKYSINFDKVRFNQIQSYSRQMREGLMLRMVDEDLNITSENTTRLIVDHAVPNENQVPMYVQEEVDHIDEPKDTTYTFYKKNSDGEPKSGSCIKREMMGSERPGYSKLSFSIPKLNGLAKYAYMPAGQTETTDGSGISIWEPYHSAIPFDNFKLIDMIDRYHVEMQILNSGAFGGVLSMENITVNVRITENVSWAESVKTYPETGTFLPAICRDYVHFKAGKFYEVLVDLNEESYAGQSWFWLSSGTHGSGESAVRNDQIFLTTSPQDIETRYTVPQFTKTFVRNMGGGMRRWKFSFYLPDSFNEIDGYYVAFLYATPDNTGTTKTDFGRIRMVSVTEKDLDAQGNVVNYVDFLVRNISIKIQDNTRPDDTRIMGSYPEPIFEINAQIEEQTKASAWGSLMNNVEKTRIESEQQKRTYEMLAQAARLNYQNLLNLKNNIFDPDGTCNDVFLQVMMLQVGADSMNYQLDYTFTTPTGVMSNFDVARKGGVGNQFFSVRDDDVLHHFVYAQGAGNAGTWQIPGNFEAELAPEEGEEGETIWPTYYVCIRCKRDVVNDLTEPAWICSTKQYAVNDEEDTDYWYFNWGILTADSNGNYTLQETRGNAYMYGDNIIAGKISTIAGNSYFDLTHGNFVLSKYGPDGNNQYHEGLTYIDGVLTIYGINDGSETSILTRLGLTEGVANGAATAAANAAAAAAAAQQAAEAAQAAVDNVTNDGIISKGTEKQELNREFIIIAGSNRDGEGADGSYYKNITQADEYGLDHSVLDNAFEDLYAAMKVVLGTSQSTCKIDGSKIQQDTYIGGLKNGIATYEIRQPFGENMYSSIDPLVVNSTKSYTGVILENSKVYLLSIGIVEGNAMSLFAIKNPRNSTYDNIAKLVEKDTSDYATFENISRYISNVSSELGFMCGTSAGGQQFKLTDINIRPLTNIGINEFNALWKNYYDAEVELLNRISNTIDEREIGGENIAFISEITDDDDFRPEDEDIYRYPITYFHMANNARVYEYFEAGTYVFSAERIYSVVDDSDYDIHVRLQAVNRSGVNSVFVELPYNGDRVRDVVIRTTEDCRFEIVWMASYYDEYSDQTSGSLRIEGMQLQKGTKSTSHQDYVKHLTDALHGTTEIAGGLTMTNLLMLKNEQGQVKAGMSGLTGDAQSPENVAMWAGGTYKDALRNAAGLLGQLVEILPVLITKTGIGSRIGCFNVDTANQVSVVGEDKSSKILINTGTANTGAFLSMIKSNQEIIRITTDEIHPEKETVEFGRFDFSSSYKTLFQNGEDTTGKVIQLETFKLIPASCKLSKTNVVHMRFKGIMNSSSMTLSFSIYVGGKYLMGISNQSISHVDVSGGWYVFDKLFTVSLPNTLNLSSLASEDVVIDMRNISYSGGVSSVSMQLLAFGEGELTGGAWSAEDGKWNDYNLRLYHANIAARTAIGRNGLSTMGSDGVSVNFLMEEGTLVFRAIGLPQKKTSTKQVISQNYSLQQFRTLLRDLIAGWNSHTQETRVAYANEMYAALPSLIKSLSVQ